MTEERRREIVNEYLSMLQAKARKGLLRKSWVPKWLEEKGISRRTLYNWLALHKVAHE